LALLPFSFIFPSSSAKSYVYVGTHKFVGTCSAEQADASLNPATPQSQTSLSVPLIVGSKCTLAASHAAPWWVTARCQRDKQSERYRQRWTNAWPLHHAKRGQCNKT